MRTKRVIVLALLIAIMLTAIGCSQTKRFQRIYYNSNSLGEALSFYITDTTEVINNYSCNNIPGQLPIYSISKHYISESDFYGMLQNLGIEEYQNKFVHQENRISGDIVGMDSRDYLTISEEELLETAQQLFEKIPFIEGQYECIGQRTTGKIKDSEGEHIWRAGVSFRRVLDGMRIIGNDRIDLYFDGNGLEGLVIELFDYKKIGTMDLVPIQQAEKNILKPDSFDIDDTGIWFDKARTLETERLSMYWVNQHSEGCSILQPIYRFSGTAYDINDQKAPFQSIVIAIPESYTYEKKNED